LSPRTVRRLINIWPPFLFAGIRVTKISRDWCDVTVELRLRWWNRNPARTHFGGSLFSMTDPFYALMLQHALGPDYTIWDAAASINFIAPGRGTVQAVYHLPQARIDEIRTIASGGGKTLPEFDVDIFDRSGKRVARVKKTVYVRRKPEV
jgi:acyl-coenzyme A thioesterase PaaI-like protein